MEDLMTVVKEANSGVRQMASTGILKTNEDAFNHYRPFYERVKDQCSDLNFFMNICMMDLQYGFIGGAISK